MLDTTTMVTWMEVLSFSCATVHPDLLSVDYTGLLGLSLFIELQEVGFCHIRGFFGL